MSFIYPRVVSISRPTGTAASAGLQSIQEFRAPQFTAVVSGLAASIQFSSNMSTPLVGAPGDAASRGTWKIFIPRSAAVAAGVNGPGAIQDRDVVTDDAGISYQTTQAYWNSLGWQLRCERLEA